MTWTFWKGTAPLLWVGGRHLWRFRVVRFRLRVPSAHTSNVMWCPPGGVPSPRHMMASAPDFNHPLETLSSCFAKQLHSFALEPINNLGDILWGYANNLAPYQKMPPRFRGFREPDFIMVVAKCSFANPTAPSTEVLKEKKKILSLQNGIPRENISTFSCKKEPLFSSTYLFLLMDCLYAWAYGFFIIILYCPSLFWYSNCPRFGQWKTLQAGVCVRLTWVFLLFVCF